MVSIVFAAEFFWSTSRPDHRYGGFGRITGLELLGTKLRYPINVESIFYFPSEHNDEARYRALREEVSFLLENLGFMLAP